VSNSICLLSLVDTCFWHEEPNRVQPLRGGRRGGRTPWASRRLRHLMVAMRWAGYRVRDVAERGE
jgi:hypothetical protein